VPAPRNPLALHPLMRKGGAHTRSATACRARVRRQCEDEAAEYLAMRAGEGDDRVSGRDNDRQETHGEKD